MPDAVNVFALMTFALLMLPPEPLVTTLPAVILPDATNVLADITLTLDMLPPLPVLNRLPTVVLPVAFNVPATLTPVPVTTITVLPTAVRLMLPFAVAILTLLLPLLILLDDPPATVDHVNVPVPSVCRY